MTEPLELGNITWHSKITILQTSESILTFNLWDKGRRVENTNSPTRQHTRF